MLRVRLQFSNDPLVTALRRRHSRYKQRSRILSQVLGLGLRNAAQTPALKAR
jgi:hypothetical protein